MTRSIGVSITPGLTAFTRMAGAHSTAICRVSADQARLARRVVAGRLGGVAAVGGDRADVDHRPAGGLRRHRLAGEERAAQVHREHGVPPRGVELQQRADAVDPGGVDEQLDVPAEPRACRGDGGVDRAGVRDVGAQRERAERRGGRVDALGGVEQGDRGALGRQQLRGGAADPRRAARHERPPPGEAAAHVSSTPPFTAIVWPVT